MKIPTLNLKRQYENVDIHAAVDRVVSTMQFIGGAEIAALEGVIAEYCGCEYAVAVSSGTDALIMALLAMDIGEGDEVITTPYTFFATAEAILRVGAMPVFADIDLDTYNIDVDMLEKAVTSRTKAIIPVHLFGLPCKMNEIAGFAKEHDLVVVEDACQAIGAKYYGKPVGSLGKMGCFSFFPSKNLGCMGDGGIVTTNDKLLYDKLRMLRSHGSASKYYHVIIGGNFRLDAIQAAILNEKVPYLGKGIERRRQIAGMYRADFVALGDRLLIPSDDLNHLSSWNQYVIRFPNNLYEAALSTRDELQKYLLTKNVETAVYYPLPLNQQPAVPDRSRGKMPCAERLSRTALALPMYPELTDEEVLYVINSVYSFFKELG